MDVASLRAALRPFVGALKDSCTNTQMPEFCAHLGLPSPPQGGDKRGRMHAALDALPDDDVAGFADPKTVAQRGAQALLTHRMDFLMLLPGSGRVVLEVDGVQHYADASGRADPRQYARLAAGERELKLAGYEVYRFAGVELQQDGAPAMVRSFFEMLLKRHGVPVR